jgi:hypothetical protein
MDAEPPLFLVFQEIGGMSVDLRGNIRQGTHRLLKRFRTYALFMIKYIIDLQIYDTILIEREVHEN